ALLEGAEAARATASGMAAVTAALMASLAAGKRLVASRALFGSCRYVVETLLPRFGVETVLVDGEDLGQWREALKRKSAAVFLETPANPGLQLVDIGAVSRLAHAAGARVIVDNAFASPLLQRPLALGADVVVYSATKHIDGQGRCLGGAVLGDAKFIDGDLAMFLRHTGPSMSPFNAWVLAKALETLELRMARHIQNTDKVIAFLAGRRGIADLRYPFLASHPQADLARRQMTAGGNMIAFSLPKGQAQAFRFLNALKLIDISNNLGDAKSLATHPATTTHRTVPAAERARLGIGPGLLRLSVGLEDADDLIDDLAQALDAARA
ncbi:MAG: O-succinylhomoserine sulfhydrylase, partial [Alphaproteobacteria bacterium]|nr:O-succinylhomoserine sulfhydrylase [Alphaproteobacteria bacterium]